jgi:tRNA-2-methylthio-N6-dimethylallyladenosine synthase
VARLRAAIPGLALTTDIIVGFPGETEEEFAETLEMVTEIGFDDAYTFKFSAREGTPATRLPESWTISDEVASERLARLIATVRAGTRAINLGMLGTRHEVLVEKLSRRGTLLQARTRHHRTVLVPGDDSMIGRYVMVELTGTTGSTFTGAVASTRAALPMAG